MSKKSTKIWKNYASRYYYLTGCKPNPKWKLKQLHDAVDVQEAKQLKVYVRGKYYDCIGAFKWSVRLQAKINRLWQTIKTLFQ